MAITSIALLNKKVDKVILSSLSLGQKHPGIRQIFKLMSRAFTAGRLRRFGDIIKIKGFQGAVNNLTKIEKKTYTNRLVPLGFPLLVGLKPLVRSAARIAPEIASKVSNIKSLEKNLQQHITFLQAETFFQKAHKTAKKSGIIGRSEMARSWYHDYALEQGLDFRSLEMIREGGKRIKDLRLGRMYFFRYEPVAGYKHNYDAFPLVFMLYEDPDNFSGINFHYLSPKLRAILLGHMFTFFTDQNFSNRTRLFARKFMQVIQTNKRFRHAKAIFKNYRPENIQSKIIQVHPLDWELAIMVPTERFKTPTGGRIASKKIWRETAIKARTI